MWGTNSPFRGNVLAAERVFNVWPWQTTCLFKSGFPLDMLNPLALMAQQPKESGKGFQQGSCSKKKN